ncbi:cytochrome P450 [Periconia macrospinosa]|uniref:Cytochrome P450 n=1 Tax=Periconia macrospinosa TaxID=97972 RepID=A0A2V1EBS9_9PLEO|nr:cytochrome P450 [Periconia macrospinosa]
MGYFSFTNIAVTLTTLIVARRIYWELTTGSRQRSIAQTYGCLPPKQKKWKDPFLSADAMIGNYRAIKAHGLLDFWGSWLKDNDAHTIWTKILGSPIILTIDPENVKSILATQFSHFSVGQERINLLSASIGKGIFTSDGAEWKHSRDMLRPCFERNQVADTLMLDRHVTRLIETLPTDGSTVNLQVPFQRLAFDITSDFLLGKSVNALSTLDEQNSASRDFVEAFDYVMDPLSEKNKNARWGMFAMFLPDAEHKRCVKRLQNFVDNIISEELSSQKNATTNAVEPSDPVPKPPVNRHLFLTSLLSETSDLVRARSELLNILAAGRDATSAVLTNLFYELPRHPTVYKRLEAEIRLHASPSSPSSPDEPPTYDQLKNMKYLRAVINEVQRIYPILPSNSRQAIKDSVLPRGGGTDGMSPMLVPKGTYVAYHVHSLQRRHDIYGADANEFVPERWLDPEHDNDAGTERNEKLRPGWAYIPFNGGPRVCIGQNFAMTQVMFVLVRMMQMFDIESRDDEPWREKITLTCSNLGGAKVGLKRKQELA